MSDFIPLGITTHILSNLDVKTLLRCRSVSKQWRSLIDSRDFILTHINQSIKTNKNSKLFLQKEENVLSVIDFDNIQPGDSLTIQDHPVVRSEKKDITIFGSCNGLLCVTSDEEHDGFDIGNMSIRKYKGFVPCVLDASFRLGADGDLVFATGYGFGYDAVSCDYKIVTIAGVIKGHDMLKESEMIVYHVRKNLRRIMKMPYLVRAMQGVCVGGALHWIAIRFRDSKVGPDVIVGFDLGVEEFRELPEPDYKVGDVICTDIGVLGDCLYLFANIKDSGVDVWVMKEYMVKESWNKVFSISNMELCYYDSVNPLAYSRTGREVLLHLDKKRLVWYDIEKKRAKNVVIKGKEKEEFEAVMCLNSLVSPDDDGGIFVSQQSPPPEKPRKTMKKKRDDFLSTGFKLTL